MLEEGMINVVGHVGEWKRLLRMLCCLPSDRAEAQGLSLPRVGSAGARLSLLAQAASLLGMLRGVMRWRWIRVSPAWPPCCRQMDFQLQTVCRDCWDTPILSPALWVSEKALSKAASHQGRMGFSMASSTRLQQD